MPDVVMQDHNTVLIRGTSAGGLIDAVMNNRDDSAAIHDAFMAWLTQHDADLLAGQQAKADEAISQLQIAFDEREQALQAELKQQATLAETLLQQAEMWKGNFREAAAANQQMNAKVQEQQTHLHAAAALVNVLMTGTGEAAVAATREFSRLNAIVRQRSAEAELAEHERIASESNTVPAA